MNWQDIEDDKEKYQAYLASREWCEKREAVRERAGNKCERCCLLPMDACHHLTYARKYNERLEDLQAICTPCHEFTHGKSDFDPFANRNFIEWASFEPTLTLDDCPIWIQVDFLAVCTGSPELYTVLMHFLAQDQRWAFSSFVPRHDDVNSKIFVRLRQLDNEMFESFTSYQKMFFRWLESLRPLPQPRSSYLACVKASRRRIVK